MIEKGYFEKKLIITPDYCDASARMSPVAVFTIFQGIAAEHAEALGVGGAAMARRGEFWLTVHTRVDFFHHAGLVQEVTACTWPERCEERAVRCFRGYSLHREDGKLVALGRTQWAILGPEGQLMHFDQSGFPANYPYAQRAGIAERPARFQDDFTEADLIHSCAVRSTDIDMGRHMNNVAYVRLLLDQFPAATLAEGNISSIEIHYAAPCLEGETLRIFRKQQENLCRMAVKKADGKTAVLAAIRFRAGE